MILVTWVTGAALAALGGVLSGLSDNVMWDMGFTMLLLMFAAVVLGGLGHRVRRDGRRAPHRHRDRGEHVSGSESKYGSVSRSAVLIVVVLVRPQGILGRPGADRLAGVDGLRPRSSVTPREPRSGRSRPRTRSPPSG